MVLITGKNYDRMKFLAQILLPAIGTLYFALAGIWGLPKAEEVVGTIVAVDAFLGVLLGLSQSAYDKSDARFSGTIHVGEENADGMQNFRLDLPASASEVSESKEIVLKVQHPDGGISPSQAITPRKKRTTRPKP